MSGGVWRRGLKQRRGKAIGWMTVLILSCDWSLVSSAVIGQSLGAGKTQRSQRSQTNHDTNTSYRMKLVSDVT